ncbi:protein BIG GRAIN 1-like [Lolium rigidum]|uniref:protein BIG GRAIN 1-like n=1 Tax=Lolium rigidum TaxID=89674 RepID=UPI001F5CDFCA|nr:protein BIG GRAIN 1-like [Lolium rigidum]
MERWGEKGTAAARARRHADQPSFSSTLLDAIYKSMEDDPGHASSDTSTKKKQQEALHYSYYYRPSLAGSYRARAPAPGPHATTSSSSDCSSYGGFSSSEAESSNHRRLRPIRTTASAGGAPNPPAPDQKKPKKPAGASSIRAKLRDLRHKPASPGARLAGFLNTIFAGKRSAPQTPAAAAEYACSSASSYSRSCLSKTPSTRGQAGRTVRFVVDSDADAAPERRTQAVEQMLLRRMEMESDEDDDEEDEESSDASSDLFELENLAAVAPRGGAGYSDELPVYETTRVVLNRGIVGHGRSARVV